MAEVIRMPAVMAGAVEASVQTWLVQPGQRVHAGQTLAEIETDKAVVEFAAESDGAVGRLLAAAGDSVAVGDPILVLLADGEDDADADAAITAAGGTPPAAVTADPEPVAPAPSAASAPAARPEPPAPAGSADADGVPADGRRLFASPLVRRIASAHGIDLRDVRGTGPHGRVVRRDLEHHLAAASPTPSGAGAVHAAAPPAAVPVAAPPNTGPAHDAGYVDLPVDRMRRTIARRLTESTSTVPHFHVVADCVVDALLALRAQVNASAARRVSVNDFVLKAVAAALRDVPEANAIWNDDSIRRFTSVDVSVAVATDTGLTTPVLRGLDRMTLTEVGAAVADLAERSRTGRLRQHELEGGSFTVSNLGMYGTKAFDAILNPPQSGILAVGAARTAPVVDENGALAVATVMTVTLSADHRVLDGAVAARWMAAFQRRIENPLTTLI